MRWNAKVSWPTPTTVDGCAPTLTANYNSASFANMISVAHYPMMGVIEIGEYEEVNSDKR